MNFHSLFRTMRKTLSPKMMEVAEENYDIYYTAGLIADHWENINGYDDQRLEAELELSPKGVTLTLRTWNLRVSSYEFLKYAQKKSTGCVGPLKYILTEDDTSTYYFSSNPGRYIIIIFRP